MNIDKKLIFLYNKNPYFNINFYKNFYDEFKNYNNEDIINHYLNYGLTENRLTCKKDFYNKYKEFTTENYKNFNTDLSNINNEIELMKHYINYGIYENRIISKNDFLNKNKNFDIFFYKSFFNLPNVFSDKNIIVHYLNNKDNKFISKDIFYEIYPLFEVYLYKYLNNDLYSLNEIDLLKHYNEFGFIEKRKCSIDDFFNLYKNFDFFIYKKFQENSDSLSYIEIIIDYLKSIYASYYNIASLEDFFKKYNYFNIDLYKIFNNIEDDNYINILYNFYINDKDNIIFSLESFYKKYNNFNYLVYKNNNKNVENLNEIDTIIYWYKNDFNSNNFKLNNLNLVSKKNILIYTDYEFNINNLESVNLYMLAKNLEKYGEQVRIYNLYNNYKFNNIFNNFSYDLLNLENKIIIYSHKISGNPLKAQFYIKILLKDNNKNSFLNNNFSINNENIIIDKYKNLFDSIIKNNFLYYFANDNTFNINYLKNNDNIINNESIHNNSVSLTFFEFNPLLKNLKKNREKYCHNSYDKINIRFKSLIDNLNLSENDNLYQIDKYNIFNDYIEIFNNYEFFISFEPYSYLNFLATLCGCITIIYPIVDVSKNSWTEKTILSDYLKYKKSDFIYGISYGIYDIEYAKNTINNVHEQWNDISLFFKDHYINTFLNKIHAY